MDDRSFKQQLALTLAGNPEFVKCAHGGYREKFIWFSLSEQINSAIDNIKISKESEAKS